MVRGVVLFDSLLPDNEVLDRNTDYSEVFSMVCTRIMQLLLCGVDALVSDTFFC